MKKASDFGRMMIITFMALLIVLMSITILAHFLGFNISLQDDEVLLFHPMKSDHSQKITTIRFRPPFVTQMTMEP